MKYITTKKQRQKQIDKYQHVCRSCGGNLSPIKTVDNSNNPTYWGGCKKCSVFDYGVSPKIYEIAKKMVIDRHFRAYSYDKEPMKTQEPAMYKYWLAGQISGACIIVSDILNLDKTIQL